MSPHGNGLGHCDMNGSMKWGEKEDEQGTICHLCVSNGNRSYLRFCVKTLNFIADNSVRQLIWESADFLNLLTKLLFAVQVLKPFPLPTAAPSYLLELS